MIVCYYVPFNKLMRFNKRIVNPLKIHKWLVIFFGGGHVPPAYLNTVAGKDISTYSHFTCEAEAWLHV